MTTLLVFLLFCLWNPQTDARWPRAARPLPRSQERRIHSPSKPLPRSLVPRWNYPQSNQRVSRIHDWRGPGQPKNIPWENVHNKVPLQDNRWNPFFAKQPIIIKSGRHSPRHLPGPQPRPSGARWLVPGSRSKVTPKQQPRNPPPPQEPPRQKSPGFTIYPANPNSIIESQPSIVNYSPNSISSAPVNIKTESTNTRYDTNLKSIRTYHPNSNRRIDTGVIKDGELAEVQEVSNIELSGLTIYKFKGEDGIGGYVQPTHLPINWGQAEIIPRKIPQFEKPLINLTPKPVTQRPKLPPPPFPTRHTTHRPDLDRHPVIIIAQSNVLKN